LIQNFKVSITPDIKELITGVTFGHVDLPNYKIPVLATIPGVEPYKNHPFVEWYQGLIQLASKTDSFKRSADAYRIINGTFTNIDLSSSSLTAKIRSEFQKFKKAYPFLHFNQWNSDKTHLVQMLRYMTAMDLLDEFEAEANKEK